MYDVRHLGSAGAATGASGSGDAAGAALFPATGGTAVALREVVDISAALRAHVTRALRDMETAMHRETEMRADGSLIPFVSGVVRALLDGVTAVAGRDYNFRNMQTPRG
jgi:hypothetical protein